MTAAKVTRKPTIRKTTPNEIAFAALFAVAAEHVDAAKRHEAQAIIMRAALAAMAQSKAEAEWEKSSARSTTTADAAERASANANAAQRETCAAGAALARALKGAS